MSCERFVSNGKTVAFCSCLTGCLTWCVLYHLRNLAIVMLKVIDVAVGQILQRTVQFLVKVCSLFDLPLFSRPSPQLKTDRSSVLTSKRRRDVLFAAHFLSSVAYSRSSLRILVIPHRYMGSTDYHRFQTSYRGFAVREFGPLLCHCLARGGGEKWEKVRSYAVGIEPLPPRSSPAH